MEAKQSFQGHDAESVIPIHVSLPPKCGVTCHYSLLSLLVAWNVIAHSINLCCINLLNITSLHTAT